VFSKCALVLGKYLAKPFREINKRIPAARGDLSGHEWQQLEPLLPPKRTGQQGNLYKGHRTPGGKG